MEKQIFSTLSLILILGISAQWIAWRMHLPSILVLLLFGFVAGPVLRILDPDLVFGNLLFPIVSFSVALILFEGGLSLKWHEFRASRKVIINLVTLGVLVTFASIALAAYYILHFSLPIALLIGAILTVTGPTVVLPLLRHIRPRASIRSVLKWEGMLNDPVGAVLAVLVFEMIFAGGFREATKIGLGGLFRTLLVGGIIGYASAKLISEMISREMLPKFLQNPVILMIVIAGFWVSNQAQHESGLFTVTLMGVLLANQDDFPVNHIVEFKENLGVLLLSALFIMLAARVELQQLQNLGMQSLLFLGFVMFVARPLAVGVSTLGSGLSWQEKAFLAWLAPRGIVAAAVTAIFALRLEEHGAPEASALVPLIFMVIIATITIQGLTAAPLAKRLDLRLPNPQGFVILGADPVGCTIGKALQSENYDVLMVDTNRESLELARGEQLQVHQGNALADEIVDAVELDGIGSMLAMTSNDEVNALAALNFADEFGEKHVYQLAPAKEPKRVRPRRISARLRGRIAFREGANRATFRAWMADGASVLHVTVPPEFTVERISSEWHDDVIPLFHIDGRRNLAIFTAQNPPTILAGDTLILFVRDAARDRVREAFASVTTMQETEERA